MSVYSRGAGFADKWVLLLALIFFYGSLAIYTGGARCLHTLK